MMAFRGADYAEYSYEGYIQLLQVNISYQTCQEI